MKKLLLCLSIAFCTIANAQYTKILDFTGGNGSKPSGSLIFDGTFLYGMTYDGGNLTNGNIFKIKPDGTGYNMLKQFSGGTNGYFPYGSLISTGGFLYGMTNGGGTGGAGTIFKVKTDGTSFSYFFNFTFSATGTGSRPSGSLISDGTFLYGMTNQGGANNKGVIFKVTPLGTGYTKLLDFSGLTNGATPYGDLISDGTYLYGMTSAGGSDDSGVVFKIKPDGTGYTKLLDFTGLNGKNPQGSLVSDGTFLYGMTAWGGTTNGGTIFKIKPDGTGYIKLLDFDGNAGGFFPYGSLIYSGSYLYGMTTYGPGANSCGTVFKIKTDGTGYINMFSFSPANGTQPMGSLISDGTFLYGMTRLGGTGNNFCTSGIGTVFKLGINTLGIDENNPKVDFVISPNPFSVQTVLHTDIFLHNATLTVDNCFGQTVAQIKNINGQTVTLNRDNLASGLYFVRLTEENKIIAVDKLVIVDE